VVAELVDGCLRQRVQEGHGVCHGAARFRRGEVGSQVALLNVVEALVGLLVKAEHLHVN